MGIDEVFKIIVYIAGGLIAMGGGGAVVMKIIKYFSGLNEMKKRVEKGEVLDRMYEQDHILLSELLEHQKSQDDVMKNNSNGLQALLRNEIVRLYRDHMKEKEISIVDLDNAEHMYCEYKNLGGNGVALKLINNLRELPVKNDN